MYTILQFHFIVLTFYILTNIRIELFSNAFKLDVCMCLRENGTTTSGSIITYLWPPENERQNLSLILYAPLFPLSLSRAIHKTHSFEAAKERERSSLWEIRNYPKMNTRDPFCAPLPLLFVHAFDRRAISTGRKVETRNYTSHTWQGR